MAMKYVLILFLISSVFSEAQEKNRFQNEVEGIQKKYDTIWDASKETVVFTGSSSIRIWKELPKLFPNHQIVNTGFGASHSTDLLIFNKELILNYNPYQVFIYEGDNDISSGRNPYKIIKNIRKIVAEIWTHNPNVEIVLISAKPSLTRWSLKRKYKRFNRKLKKLTKRKTSLYFADVWNPMLNGKEINKNLFIKDGLHMNAKGYEIWYSVIKPFVIN